MNKTKTIIVVQLIFIIGVVAFIYGFAPRLYYPTGNIVLEDGNVDFSFKNAQIILIDDNQKFVSPLEINLENSGANATLEPGTYYWKAVGILESSVKELTVESRVGLEINQEKLTLRNIGNVPLNLTLENGSEGIVILDVGVEYLINKSGDYRGEQYE